MYAVRVRACTIEGLGEVDAFRIAQQLVRMGIGTVEISNPRAPPPPPTVEAPISTSTTFPCETCGRSFRRTQALGVHRRWMHRPEVAKVSTGSAPSPR